MTEAQLDSYLVIPVKVSVEMWVEHGESAAAILGEIASTPQGHSLSTFSRDGFNTIAAFVGPERFSDSPNPRALAITAAFGAAFAFSGPVVIGPLTAEEIVKAHQAADDVVVIEEDQ